MSLDEFPDRLRRKFLIDERRHAASILANDFPEEFDDLCACLDHFWLRRSYIEKSGGARSDVPKNIDGFLQNERGGWRKHRFETSVVVDDQPRAMPTHEIDNLKNRIAVEVEWNNKTEFYDRDLNNFRLLFEFDVVSVGVIITRLSELQDLFKELGRGDSYGASTTHWNKLLPKVDGGGAGGCPLLLIGMGLSCYDPDS